MEAYCVKCRTQKEMKDGQVITMKNGKAATQGLCPTCGTKMFRIGKIQVWEILSQSSVLDRAMTMTAVQLLWFTVIYFGLMAADLAVNKLYKAKFLIYLTSNTNDSVSQY